LVAAPPCFEEGFLLSQVFSTSEYDYPLPEELVARYPAPRRDESRLMVLDRYKRQITHLRFSDFPGLVRSDELLVMNDTRVIPARIRFQGKEILLLEQLDKTAWRCMVRPGKWFSSGRKFQIQGLSGEVIQTVEGGDRVIRFREPIDFEQVGELPLPPYIRRDVEESDKDRYQTVYATSPGAIAAPTAGLHFTPEILEKLPHVFVTLHVGVGTFKPVKTEYVTEHRMHQETFEVSEGAAAHINAAPKVLAVGTTTVRTLESLILRYGEIRPGRENTDIFIYPPFDFRRVDALLTNFHLPRSTLLMLVAAFAGREFLLEAYREAIGERYRFFSYGDCMLIR
jgi:S-adenosylmethionine:tRNA ribosyltransferase-isomerase